MRWRGFHALATRSLTRRLSKGGRPPTSGPTSVMAVRRLDPDFRRWPAPATPTVSTLVDPDWVDLSTVVEERQVRELIPRLYEAGAPGIIEVPIDKIIE